MDILLGDPTEYDEEWVPGSTKGFRSDVDGDEIVSIPTKLLFDPWGKPFTVIMIGLKEVWPVDQKKLK